jgi:hypothetical protein
MTDSTAKLRPYVPRPHTTIEGGDEQYLTNELQRIASTLAQIITALKAIDHRMQVASPPI